MATRSSTLAWESHRERSLADTDPGVAERHSWATEHTHRAHSQFTHRVAVVSGVQQSDSVTHTRLFFFRFFSHVITEY